MSFLNTPTMTENKRINQGKEMLAQHKGNSHETARQAWPITNVSVRVCLSPAVHFAIEDGANIQRHEIGQLVCFDPGSADISDTSFVLKPSGIIVETDKGRNHIANQIRIDAEGVIRPAACETQGAPAAALNDVPHSSLCGGLFHAMYNVRLCVRQYQVRCTG